MAKPYWLFLTIPVFLVSLFVLVRSARRLTTGVRELFPTASASIDLATPPRQEGGPEALTMTYQLDLPSAGRYGVYAEGAIGTRDFAGLKLTLIDRIRLQPIAVESNLLRASRTGVSRTRLRLWSVDVPTGGPYLLTVEGLRADRSYQGSRLVFATVSAEEGSISGFLTAFFPLLLSAFLLIGSVVGTAFALAGRLTSSPAVSTVGSPRGVSADVPASPPATTGHAGVDMLLEQVRRSRSTIRARVSLDGGSPRYAVTDVVFGATPDGGDAGITLSGAPPVGYRPTSGDEVLLVLQQGAGGAGTWRAVRVLPIRNYAVTLVDRAGVSVEFAVESIKMLLAREG